MKSAVYFSSSRHLLCGNGDASAGVAGVLRLTSGVIVFDDINSKANSDPELHKLWRAALYEQKSINHIERERIAFLLARVFGAFNVAFHSSKRDREFREFVNQRLDAYLANPVVRGWWRRQRMQQPDPFRTIVDTRVNAIDNVEDTDDNVST